MSTAGSPEVLALPSAGGAGTGVEARRSTLPLAVLISGASVTTLIGGLIAAYLALRAQPGAFMPKDIEFDNYTAATLTITVLMAMVTIEWAAYGIRKGFRGQSLFGFGVTILLGIAFLNALYYLISKLTYDAGANGYATVTYAMFSVVFGLGVIGLVSILLVTLRAVGHQLTTDNYHLIRSSALLWHIVAIAWIAVYYTVYVTK